MNRPSNIFSFLRFFLVVIDLYSKNADKTEFEHSAISDNNLSAYYFILIMLSGSFSPERSLSFKEYYPVLQVIFLFHKIIEN